MVDIGVDVEKPGAGRDDRVAEGRDQRAVAPLTDVRDGFQQR